MTNIWYSSLFLYLGDTMLVAALLGGVLAFVASSVRASRRFIILDIDQTQLHKFALFQVVWLMSGLVLFKLVVLQGGPHFTKHVLTGNHGSVQFSTAGEAVAFALALYGIYRWGRWIARHVRLTNA